jgi:hypothetical protein
MPLIFLETTLARGLARGEASKVGKVEKGGWAMKIFWRGLLAGPLTNSYSRYENNGRKAAVIVLLLATGGCTKLLDHSAIGCTSDAQCAPFGHHPFCRNGVCVASKFNPKDCQLFDPPGTCTTVQKDFLNQCSTGSLPASPSDPVGECLSDSRSTDPDAGVTMPPIRPGPPAVLGKRPTVLCKDLVPPGMAVVYLSGSSNFQPLLGELAPAIVPKAMTVPVFRITTSCAGTHSMNPTGPTYAIDHFIKDPVLPSEASAQIFLGDSKTGVDCLLGPTPVNVDIGESEIFPESCEGPSNSPDTVTESLGPILPLLFIVPPGSHERAISYEAARQVFGNGGGVSPWTDPNQLFIRGTGTATLRLLAKELDLAPGQVWGIDQGNASAMATNVGGVTDEDEAQTTIGVIGADFYDLYRGKLKPLAFQAKNQECAYVPDSSLGSLDKINVRDGHYPLWGRIHFYTGRINGGQPVSQIANNFVFYLTSAHLDDDILTAFVAASFVPACAMNVFRKTELGDMSCPETPSPCGCVFDALTNPDKSHAPPGCVPCENNSDCAIKDPSNPSCNYKYCEKTM